MILELHFEFEKESSFSILAIQKFFSKFSKKSQFSRDLELCIEFEKGNISWKIKAFCEPKWKINMKKDRIEQENNLRWELG